MISQKDLKVYDFNSINEYFNYIYQSLENGQRQQVRDLIKRMSKDQKKDFFAFYLKDLSNEKIRNELILLLLEVILK